MNLYYDEFHFVLMSLLDELKNFNSISISDAIKNHPDELFSREQISFLIQ